MLPRLSQLCCSWSQGAVFVQDPGDPDGQGGVCQQPGQAAQSLCCNVILEDVPLVRQLLLQPVLPLPAESAAITHINVKQPHLPGLLPQVATHDWA